MYVYLFKVTPTHIAKLTYSKTYIYIYTAKNYTYIKEIQWCRMKPLKIMSQV